MVIDVRSRCFEALFVCSNSVLFIISSLWKLKIYNAVFVVLDLESKLTFPKPRLK